jgi:hypothetical protein
MSAGHERSTRGASMAPICMPFAVFLATTLMLAAPAVPPAAAAEKLCRAGPALEQSLEDCREGDVARHLPKADRPAAEPVAAGAVVASREPGRPHLRSQTRSVPPAWVDRGGVRADVRLCGQDTRPAVTFHLDTQVRLGWQSAADRARWWWRPASPEPFRRPAARRRRLAQGRRRAREPFRRRMAGPRS